MKKTLILAAAALMSAAFMTSCMQKTYTCTCNVDGDILTSNITGRKADARILCKSMEDTYQSSGSPDASCSL